ncbi:1-acyl-sn-glycerol-3-phosphate acyltransferase delta isoform X2 [Neofelis nebulosa]|uniref:1-acyl-sn-glycerol-3-phosphate acyltransferase delta isoform X2 n=1 Tax=Neofelis nebulosa TaxID=61452 RepID=UPI00272A7354|nr:1-acyl-sn-glycerol-3-phosphate acyltransferase delta isoform X2 [Neofelis nebulosa]
MCQGPPARRYVPFVRFPGDFTSGRGGCLCTLSWVADLGSFWKYSPASIYLSESTQPRAMDLLGLLKSQFLCHLVFCYVFIASGLIINTVQLFTLLLWPINKQLFRRINCRLSYCVSSRLQSPGQEGAGLRPDHRLDVVLHRDGLLHTQVGARPQDRLAEPAAPPGLPREVLFPDSLRGHSLHGEEAPDQHAGGPSQGAAQPQVPPAATHQRLRRHREEFEKFSAVYDCTLNFRNNENPTLLGVLNGKKYHADLYVRRIPLEEVPEDEDECSAWLHKLYQEKDAFQEEYYRTGTFPETPMVPPRRPWTLINWLFWASLLLYPFFRFLTNMISSGSSLTLASFVLVFFVASMGVRWMIGVTEIDKGSAYGNIDSKQKRND